MRQLLSILFVLMFPILLLLHWIFYPITQHVLKHRRIKYGDIKLYSGKHVKILLDNRYDLMLTTDHFYEKYKFDNEYAHNIILHIGGLYISCKYGHDFIVDKNPEEESTTHYYGLYCVDSPVWTWDTWWWGTHLYNLPWLRMEHIGTFDYDMSNNTLVKYEFKPGCNCDEHPYARIMKNCVYHDKNGGVQEINEIKWKLTERRYTSKLLQWLGLGNMFPKRYIDLEFDSDSEMGVRTGSWKGGVMGGGIKIDKKTEPRIWELYIDGVKHGDERVLKLLKTRIDMRIDFFMTKERKY